MYVCILGRDGRIVAERNMESAPEPFLNFIAPYREYLVVRVECIFTWYWLADLRAREAIRFILGRALYMKEGPHKGWASVVLGSLPFVMYSNVSAFVGEFGTAFGALWQTAHGVS